MRNDRSNIILVTMVKILWMLLYDRSVIERERKQAKLKQQSRPEQETKTKRGPSPAMEVAPPQRVTTPVKASR